MEQVFYILAKTVSLTLSIVSFAMLVRMIIPWFTDPTENKIYFISCLVTEPFIAPVRAIMIKLDIGQKTPIDWAFTITYLIIILLRSFLPEI